MGRRKRDAGPRDVQVQVGTRKIGIRPGGDGGRRCAGGAVPGRVAAAGRRTIVATAVFGDAVRHPVFRRDFTGMGRLFTSWRVPGVHAGGIGRSAVPAGDRIARRDRHGGPRQRQEENESQKPHVSILSYSIFFINLHNS